jgi:hypothetical protein
MNAGEALWFWNELTWIAEQAAAGAYIIYLEIARNIPNPS